MRATSQPQEVTPAASTDDSLSPVELRSRKRRRGDLQPAVGAPLKQYTEGEVRSKDKTVWHRDSNPQLPPITSARIEPGGTTTATSGATSPEDFFSLLLDDTMLARICVYTNQRIESLRQKYKIQDCVVTRNVGLMEMKGFLGLIILSGVKKDSHLTTEEMWSPVIGAPLYRSTISERRFTFLLRALRFDDSTTREARAKKDRLAPIRQLWDDLVRHCGEMYIPGPHLTVDEQLLSFRGKCVFRMYIPNKPAK